MLEPGCSLRSGQSSRSRERAQGTFAGRRGLRSEIRPSDFLNVRLIRRGRSGLGPSQACLCGGCASSPRGADRSPSFHGHLNLHVAQLFCQKFSLIVANFDCEFAVLATRNAVIKIQQADAGTVDWHVLFTQIFCQIANPGQRCYDKPFARKRARMFASVFHPLCACKTRNALDGFALDEQTLPPVDFAREAVFFDHFATSRNRG